jgi:hypothetical protein
MPKFIRLKSDGFVVDFNPVLAVHPNAEVFDCATDTPPERIENLLDFLSAEQSGEPEAPARRKRAAAPAQE